MVQCIQMTAHCLAYNGIWGITYHQPLEWSVATCRLVKTEEGVTRGAEQTCIESPPTERRLGLKKF